MQIDTSLAYELHRPRELGGPSTEAQVRQMLPDDQFTQWQAARDRAGTAGPIMVGGQVSRMPGSAVDELYTTALKGGANPCYVHEETGQVCLGEFVFVPVRD